MDFYFLNEDFNQAEAGKESSLEWAARVFTEPQPNGPSFDPVIVDLDLLSREQEMSLYTDLYSRDSEVGLGLLLVKRAALVQMTATIRATLANTRRDLAFARARLDSLKKINATEQNAQFRYSDRVFADLTREIELLSQQRYVLAKHTSQLYALEQYLKLLDDQRSLGLAPRAEQLLRLLSHSVRGLLKVQSWATREETKSVKKPALVTYTPAGGDEGYLFQLGGRADGIVLDKQVTGYLIHLLGVVEQLASETRRVLQDPDTEELMENWDIPHQLVRAIIELFHFCNFELIYNTVNLATNCEAPAQCWQYDYKQSCWQEVDEDPNASRNLKRSAAEVGLLFLRAKQLMSCQQPDELNRWLNTVIAAAKPSDEAIYQPYWNCGLAHFDLAYQNQRFKIYMAHSELSMLLDALVASAGEFTYIAKSTFGGVAATLTGMALLDSTALGLDKEIDPTLRFQILSNCWRSVSRRRAIAMFGNEYLRTLSNGLAAIGEPRLENPATTHLAALTGPMMDLAVSKGTTYIGKTGLLVTKNKNPFCVIGETDQTRLLNLLEQTWAVADAILPRLQSVRSPEQLRIALSDISVAFDRQRPAIAEYFKFEWRQSAEKSWAVLRGCSPTLWQFWVATAQQERWERECESVKPPEALAKLLRLFGDTLRLMLVAELGWQELNPGEDDELACKINSEGSAQALVISLLNLLEMERDNPTVISETLNSYFDPEIKYDFWLAFASTFKKYLRQCANDLRLIGATDKQVHAIEELVRLLDEFQPDPEPVVQKITTRLRLPAATYEPITLLEIQTIEQLLAGLLYGTRTDRALRLKLAVMATYSDGRRWLTSVNRHQALIGTLIGDPEQCRRFFEIPRSARSFWESLDQVAKASPSEVQPKLKQYLSQFNKYYESRATAAARYPKLSNESRGILNRYLAQPSAQGVCRYLLLNAYGHLVIDIAGVDVSVTDHSQRTVTRLIQYLQLNVNSTKAEASYEVVVLGGGQIVVRGDQIILGAGAPAMPIVCTEPDAAQTSDFLAHCLAARTYLTAGIIRTAMPENDVVTEF
ncbi:MAG: hypothetical protein AB1489_29095 [Acidobacteriota bacterium]